MMNQYLLRIKAILADKHIGAETKVLKIREALNDAQYNYTKGH